MPTSKKRVSIPVNEEMYKQIMAHRNRLDGMSISQAAFDLIVKGMKADGIVLTDPPQFEDLRKRTEKEVGRAKRKMRQE